MLWYGLATSTRKTYTTATNSYTEYCALFGKRPFPVEAEESGNESIVMMFVALLGPLYIFLCLSTFSEMVNAVILKLSDVHPSVDFQTILWTAKEGVVCKIHPNENNYNCFPTLLGLQGWVHSVECQVVFPLRTGIYLFAPIALSGTSVCHYHLKYLYRCLNMVLYPDDQVLQDQLMQV